MTKILRKVAVEAMAQTEKTMCSLPVGVRVHMQFAIPKHWDDDKQEMADAGLMSPPQDCAMASCAVLQALSGVCFDARTSACQVLSTKAYGPVDAIAITCWAIEKKA